MMVATPHYLNGKLVAIRQVIDDCKIMSVNS